MNGEQYTYIKAKEYVKTLGFEIIGDFSDNEIIKTKQKIILRDSFGYLYISIINNLKNDFKPRFTHKSNPYSIQNIKLWCKLNNKPFELVDEQEYKDSNIFLKWKCLKEECGEIFEATWICISTERGCPFCASKQVGLSNCLVTTHPELAKEWHPTLNGDLTPYDITYGSMKRVWWQCSKNKKHIWNTFINDRGSGNNGCPYCSGKLPSEDYNLLVTNPDICEEWDYKKNKKRPEEYTRGSTEKVWWKCKEHNHEWFVSILNRAINGNGCPYCSGLYATKENNLLMNNPELCKEWDYNKNDKNPEEYTPKSDKKVWWICKNCGCEWEARISRRNGYWKTGCPKCNKSKGEKRIDNYFTQIGLTKYKDYIPQKEFEGLAGVGKRLLSYDFYLPEYNLLIEYQGEQHEKFIKGFHKSKKYFQKQVEHDKRKKEYANKHNINLLEIWYYDFDNIETILKKELSLKRR